MLRFAAVVLAFLLVSPAGAYTLEDFKKEAQEAVDNGLSPAFAFAIVDDNGVRWTGAFGQADIESAKRADADTVFTMASVSKTLIGTAGAIAAREGKLDPDADINDYLSFSVEHPGAPETPITFTNLATHTSGIIDDEAVYETAYAFGETVYPEALRNWLISYLSPGGERYDAAKNFHESAPGAQYEYSNIAAALAAQVIEDAVGEPFAAYTRKKILKPLGMDDTSWFLSELNTDNIATPYKRNEDGSFAPYEMYALATWPDGGLRASVSDLATYLAAIVGKGEAGKKKLFDRTTFEILLSPVDLHDVEDLPNSFLMKGLFWSGRTAPSIVPPRMAIGHNGSDPGMTTLMYFDPLMDRGAIALSNADFDTREELIEYYRLYYKLFEVELD